MRKKTKNVIVTGLVCAMLSGAMSGCGEETKAVVNQQSEVPKSSEDNTASTEVVVDNTNVDGNVDLENENIVLYAERGEQKYFPQKDKVYKEKTNSLVSGSEILLYDGDGYEVGYIKADGIVSITEISTETAWSRFENPITGTDYDYLYVTTNYLANENAVHPTAEEATALIKANLSNRRDYVPVFVDSLEDDMEVLEFLLSKEYNSQLDLDGAVTRGSNNCSGYMTYYIECKEEANIIRCNVYYKDKYVPSFPY